MRVAGLRRTTERRRSRLRRIGKGNASLGRTADSRSRGDSGCSTGSSGSSNASDEDRLRRRCVDVSERRCRARSRRGESNRAGRCRAWLRWHWLRQRMLDVHLCWRSPCVQPRSRARLHRLARRVCSREMIGAVVAASRIAELGLGRALISWEAKAMAADGARPATLGHHGLALHQRIVVSEGATEAGCAVLRVKDGARPEAAAVVEQQLRAGGQTHVRQRPHSRDLR